MVGWFGYKSNPESLLIGVWIGDSRSVITQEALAPQGSGYVFLPKIRTIREVFGIIAHEVVEYILEMKLKVKHTKAHKIANIIEKAVSLGKAKLYW